MKKKGEKRKREKRDLHHHFQSYHTDSDIQYAAGTDITADTASNRCCY